MQTIPKRDRQRAIRVSSIHIDKYTRLIEQAFTAKLRAVRAEYKADTDLVVRELGALYKERLALQASIRSKNERIESIYDKVEKIKDAIDEEIGKLSLVIAQEAKKSAIYKATWSKNPNDPDYEIWLRANLQVKNDPVGGNTKEAISTTNHPYISNIPPTWEAPTTLVLHKHPTTDGVKWSDNLIQVCKAAKVYADTDDNCFDAVDAYTLFYKTIKAEFPQLVGNNKIPVDLMYT